jgi:hypothetical protein
MYWGVGNLKATAHHTCCLFISARCLVPADVSACAPGMLQAAMCVMPPSRSRRMRQERRVRHVAGSQKLTVTLKEIGPSLLLTLLSLIAFLAGVSNFDINVNAPKAIALSWVIYNIVPHVLLLTYARFGSGRILHFACNFLCFVQSFVSLLALILLWVLYPREEDYVRATDLSLKFLFTEWSGDVVPPFIIPWRFTSGKLNVIDLTINRYSPLNATVASTKKVPVNLSGGFYTEGEIGPVKVTTHVAMTTAMLSWSMLDYPEWWASDATRLANGLKLVQHGLEYVMACYIPAPDLPGQNPNVEPPHAPEDVMVYMVRKCLCPAEPCCESAMLWCCFRLIWLTLHA